MNYWQEKWITERNRADKYQDLFFRERKAVTCLHARTLLVLFLGMAIGIFISYMILTYHAKEMGYDPQQPVLHEQSYSKSPRMIRIRPD